MENQDSEQLEVQMEDEEIPEEVSEALAALFSKYEAEDKESWFDYIVQAEKLEFYWNGIQDLVRDPSTGHFMSAAGVSGVILRGAGIGEDEVEVDQNINIYRALGESAVSAMSASLPSVRFFPDDAEDQDDVSTAKAASKISKLIQKQNNAPFLFMQTLCILWNQHFAAAYNRQRTHPSYGTVKVPQYAPVKTQFAEKTCPNCGEVIDIQEAENAEMPMEEMVYCPNCEQTVQPVIELTEPEEVIEKVGEEEIDKSREIIEVYGPRNVFIADFVKDPSQSPYIVLEFEQHYALMRSIYPAYRDKIAPGRSNEHQFYRTNVQSGTRDNRALVTVRQIWVRPWAFEAIDEIETCALLKERFPNGVKFVMINDCVVEAINENCDDHWTFTKDPLSDHIHSMPLGKPVVPLQNMSNDVAYLTQETINQGIGETFADPEVLDFDQYGKVRARPGSVTQARPRKGQQLDHSFYQQKNANLSKEVPQWFAELFNKAQFVAGVSPSIYGGFLQAGSETLGEYRDSRDQALQRLSRIWKVVNFFWAEIIDKAVKSFSNNLIEDERFVEKEGSSSKNVWIRRAELAGKIGRVESETSEQFPVSWPQKRDVVNGLLQLKDERINNTLYHPENTTFMGEVFGLDDLYIPGEEDRDKQKLEILELLQGQPNPDGSSSVPIEPEIDNVDIHIEILRAFLNSEAGLTAKVENPMGYENCKAHLREHLMYQMEEQARQMAMQGGPEPPQGA